MSFDLISVINYCRWACFHSWNSICSFILRTAWLTQFKHIVPIYNTIAEVGACIVHIGSQNKYSVIAYLQSQWTLRGMIVQQNSFFAFVIRFIIIIEYWFDSISIWSRREQTIIIIEKVIRFVWIIHPFHSFVCVSLSTVCPINRQGMQQRTQSRIHNFECLCVFDWTEQAALDGIYGMFDRTKPKKSSWQILIGITIMRISGYRRPSIIINFNLCNNKRVKVGACDDMSLTQSFRINYHALFP